MFEANAGDIVQQSGALMQSPFLLDRALYGETV